MYRRAATLVCGVILIFALTSIHLSAQDYGTVSGTVTDPWRKTSAQRESLNQERNHRPIERSAN